MPFDFYVSIRIFVLILPVKPKKKKSWKTSVSICLFYRLDCSYAM